LILESAIADKFSIKLRLDHAIMVPEHVLGKHFLSVFIFFHFSSTCFRHWYVAKQPFSPSVFWAQVEKNKPCKQILATHFRETCLAADMFEILKFQPRGKTWSHHKLKLGRYFWCETHQQEYLDFSSTIEMRLWFLFSSKIIPPSLVQTRNPR
jgi:hypothetical protein